MLNVKKLLSLILNCDLVIESGTDTYGFKWGKYASGRLEASRVRNVGQVTVGTTISSTYKVSADITKGYPQLATSGTVAAVYIGNSTNSGTVLESITDTTFRIAKETSSNVTLQNVKVAEILINGRWK